MKLHNRILNLPCPYATELAAEHDDPEIAVYYRMGHKDARHEAAEVVLELEELLREMDQFLVLFDHEAEGSIPEVKRMRQVIAKYL
jgi:hypothetical protein